MAAIAPGVPWTSGTDDNTTTLAAANAAMEASAGGGLTPEELDALASDAELAAAIAGVDTSALVAKALFDANTILKADTDNTPEALAVAASRVVGRKATGDIEALTAAEVAAILAGQVVLALNGGQEVIQTHGNTGATETIDVANGNVHIVTQNQACTYTFTNPPSATAACSFTLVMTAVTGAATWPASVSWPGGAAPTLSGRCTLVFTTYDGGTTWDGFRVGAPSTGLTYATGSYTGDGANPKTVVTGLSDIVYLTVISTDSGTGDTMFSQVFKGATEAIYLNDANTPPTPRAVTSGQQVPNIISPAAGSFQVDDGPGTGASLNHNGRHYEWMAIGLA